MHDKTTPLRIKTLLLMAGVAAIAVPSLAAAQEGITQLDRIAVEGGTAAEQDGAGPVEGYVAKTTTTGSKSATPLKLVPQSVSVVGGVEMSDRGVVNKVDEALRYTPGVTAEPFGTDPDTDWFYIRGFDATQTGVFLDGLNLFSYGFGGFQIDPLALERIEVLKGPASVLYGGANPGGIVNMVRKRPTDEPYFYTEIGVNSEGNAFTGFDASGKLNDDGTLTYRVTGKISGGDNYSDYSEDLRGFILPQITYTPDAATSLTVYGYLSGLDQVHVGNGFLPYGGTVVDATFGRIDRDAFYGEPDLDSGKVTQKMVGYEFEHEFDNGIKFSQTARYGTLHKTETGPYTYGYTDASQTEFNRIGFEGESDVDSFSIDNRAETEFDLGETSHSLLAGIDYKYYELTHIQACCGATSISVTDPVYGVPQGANFVYLDQTLTQQQIGAYVQDQIRFGGGWLATLNGRYDYVDTESDARVGVSYTSNDTALSGRAGLAYEFDNGLTPYLSAATFFNPIIGVSPTTVFVPETGHQFEAGLKYEPAGFDGMFTASAFQITKQNVAVTVPGTFDQEQLGEVRSTGLELEAKVNLNSNWKILAAASYTDMEVTEDLNTALIGKSPVLIPDIQASLWLDYTVTTGNFEGVSLGAGVRHQGESWADADNTAKVPSATLVDAAIRFEKNDWTAALNVANVFDTVYVKGCQGKLTCGYGESRTFTLKLSKKW